MQGSARVRVAIVDAHPITRAGLVDLLTGEFPRLDVAYSGKVVSEAVTAATTGWLDLLIVDPSLAAPFSPVKVVSDLSAVSPRVLAYSSMSSPAAVDGALRAGAIGYVTKQSPSADVRAAVRATVAGRGYLSPDVADAPVASTLGFALTNREQTTLLLYTAGLKMETVARRMNVTHGTAAEYMKRVRHKLRRAGAASTTRTDIYRLAQEHGLVP